MDSMGGTEDIGARVAELRAERGWTLRDLENETDRVGNRVSAAVLQRLEKGYQDGRRPKLDVEVFVSLCRAFDVTADDLLTSAEARRDRERRAVLEEVDKAYRNVWFAAQKLYNACAWINQAHGRLENIYQEFDRLTASLRGKLPPAVHPGVLRALEGQLEQVILGGLLRSDIETFTGDSGVVEAIRRRHPSLHQVTDWTEPENRKTDAAWEKAHPLTRQS